MVRKWYKLKEFTCIDNIFTLFKNIIFSQIVQKVTPSISITLYTITRMLKGMGILIITVTNPTTISFSRLVMVILAMGLVVS